MRLFTANGIVEHMKSCSAGVDSFELLLLWEEEHASKCTGLEALIADFEATGEISCHVSRKTTEL